MLKPYSLVSDKTSYQYAEQTQLVSNNKLANMTPTNNTNKNYTSQITGSGVNSIMFHHDTIHLRRICTVVEWFQGCIKH